MNESGCTLPAGSSPPGNGNNRGGLQPPHVAQAECVPIRSFTRTPTFRLEPTKEQYALLCLRDAQATQRMNRFSIQLYAEHNGWRPPEDSSKDTLTKHGRLERDGLSSAIYVACEKRVKNDWSRIGKRIWSGVQVPTYRKGSLPFDSGARADKGGCCGIKIVRMPSGRFAARLHVTADYADGDNWIEVALGRGTERDTRREGLAAELADATRHILSGMVTFEGGKVLLRVAVKFERAVPKVGERIATLSEFEDGRLLLRAEFQTLDYSSKLNAIKAMKTDWDGIRRRFGRRAMRSKGSARRMRGKMAQMPLAKKYATEMHRWSADMVRWAIAQGCGSIIVAQLTGGDWPAYQLKANLKYKAEEAGMSFAEASLDQEPTERAATAAVKKRQRKARKLGDALREINDQFIGDKT